MHCMQVQGCQVLLLRWGDPLPQIHICYAVGGFIQMTTGLDLSLDIIHATMVALQQYLSKKTYMASFLVKTANQQFVCFRRKKNSQTPVIFSSPQLNLISRCKFQSKPQVVSDEGHFFTFLGGRNSLRQSHQMPPQLPRKMPHDLHH